MRQKLFIAGALLLVAGFAAGAADVFQTYALDRAGWSARFVNALTTRSFYPYELTARLRAVAPAERAAVVTALASLAKTYVDSPEFKAAYKKAYEDALPDAAKPPRTKEQIAAEMTAELDKSIKELEAQSRSLSGDMKAGVQQAITAMREQGKQVPMMAEMMAREEKQRDQEAKSAPPDPNAVPANPQLALKRALKEFLDKTAGVDFAAQTKPRGVLKAFVNTAYEQKPREWKMCYRAGREACEAARAFATSWLAELK